MVVDHRCSTDTQFFDEVRNFRYYGNTGPSDTDLADTVKFAHPENFRSPARNRRHISYISRIIYVQISLLQFSLLLQRDRSGATLHDIIKLADPENPPFVIRICDLPPIQAELQPIRRSVGLSMLFWGRWICRTGKWRTKKFQGVENAGLEKDGQKCRAGICRTGKWRTTLQGWKMQDWKLTDKCRRPKMWD